MPIYEPDLSYLEMRHAERVFKCSVCGSDLFTAWSKERQCMLLRCRQSIEHEGITPFGRDPEILEILNKIKGAPLPMESTALQKMNETTMLARIEKAKFPSQLSDADKRVLATVALEYGLDPLFGELMIYQGRPYVTIDARRRKAQESGTLDGVIPRPATQEERAEQGLIESDYLWRAEVWIKGSIHPCVGWGKVTKKEIDRAIKQAQSHGKQEDALPIVKDPGAQACKRAEAQGLRKGFHIPLPSAEDIIEGEFTEIVDEKSKKAKETTKGTDRATAAQATKLMAVVEQSGWTPEEVTEFISVKWGVKTAKDLSVSQMDTLIKRIEAGEGLSEDERKGRLL